MTDKYIIPSAEREILERQEMPIGIFQFTGGKTVTLLVSDGLCSLLGVDRPTLMERFDRDMFFGVHPDDAARAVEITKRFIIYDEPYQVIERYKYNETDEDYSLLFCHGVHSFRENGAKLAVISYADISGTESMNIFTSEGLADTVRDFLHNHTTPMAVVSRNRHLLYYYNESMTRIFQPAMSYDTTRTFNEFFFGDNNTEIQGLYDHVDQGIQTYENPLTHEEIDVSVTSTVWDDYPAYLLNFYESSGSEGQSLETYHLRQRHAFTLFMATGEYNSLHWNDPGYKGYLIFNLTKGRLARSGGISYYGDEEKESLTYDRHRRFLSTYITDPREKEKFDSLTSAYFIAHYPNNDYMRRIRFTIHTGQETGIVETRFLMTASPDTGDIYLKIQNENAGDRNITETMLDSLTRKMFEFIMYIDMDEDQCVILENGRRTARYSDEAEKIARRLGMKNTKIKDLTALIENMCGKASEGTAIHRLSANSAKIVRVMVLDRKKRQYFLSCTDLRSSDFRQLAIYDELTGLPNMPLLRMQSQTFLNHMEKPAVIYTNLAGFKDYNREFGYSRGDALLKKTGDILLRSFPDSLTARIADDHFVVLTEQKNMAANFERACKRVREAAGKEMLKAGIIRITSTDDVIAACDKARVAADSIHARYDVNARFYDDEIHKAYHRERYIITHFIEAVENNWIQIYYQPVIRSTDGSLCHYEGLCRWFDPKEGFISPGDFIPILENARLITRLDMHMAELMCRDLAKRKEAGMPLVPVSLNFSWIDFETCNVGEEVNAILEKYGAGKEQIVIEITERSVSKSGEFMRSQVDRLHEAGYEVWMDDFGSAYSSLNMLKDFDFDTIKFDMKFIDDLSENKKTRILMEGLVKVLKALGSETLTEGVETREQYDILKDIGIDQLQGYLIHKPASLDALIEEFRAEAH